MDIRVAAYAVIVDDGRILLAHWNWPEGGMAAWTLPGGGIEPGEHPADAAVREVWEETGFEARLDDLIGVDSVVVPGDQRLANPGVPQHSLRIVYSATITGGELVREADGSTDDAAWFRLDELESLERVQLVDTAVRFWRDRCATPGG